MKTYLKQWAQQKPLKLLELLFLSLFLLALPSLEAPKNIFLAGFVFTSLWNQFHNQKKLSLSTWDWIFLLYIISAFLSAIFASINGAEWKGFRTILITSIFGVTIIRANYSLNEIKKLSFIATIAVIPPLIYGLYQLYIVHTKETYTLMLHSVGHVNHTAIYLTIIYGAFVGFAVNSWKNKSKIKCVFLTSLLLFIASSIIITESRAAIGVFIFLTLIYIYLTKENSITKFILLTGFTAILSISIIVQTGAYQKELSKQKNHNELSRRDLIWNVSLEAYKWHPIFGIGNGNWKYIKMEDLKKSVESKNEVFNEKKYLLPGHSHQLYLTSLVERGFFGLFSIAIIMFYWLLSLIKSFKRINNTNEYLWFASLAGWSATFIIGLVNTTFHHEHALLALFFLGLQQIIMRK